MPYVKESSDIGQFMFELHLEIIEIFQTKKTLDAKMQLRSNTRTEINAYPQNNFSCNKNNIEKIHCLVRTSFVNFTDTIK